MQDTAPSLNSVAACGARRFPSLSFPKMMTSTFFGPKVEETSNRARSSAAFATVQACIETPKIWLRENPIAASADRNACSSLRSHFAIECPSTTAPMSAGCRPDSASVSAMHDVHMSCAGRQSSQKFWIPRAASDSIVFWSAMPSATSASIGRISPTE
ncbi:hypothetical protein FXV83_22430 [Bradyrhizobium hipponense]|uniref:Uncharacterized protein n=1 Tax=Bradyrhizobium hipponense TaxID=2605638 RepID=A0A5S4YKK4_9BRAD|nr:hypothetical protein FXV83_22430 [Bradyrhizobium hipponense]